MTLTGGCSWLDRMIGQVLGRTGCSGVLELSWLDLDIHKTGLDVREIKVKVSQDGHLGGRAIRVVRLLARPEIPIRNGMPGFTVETRDTAGVGERWELPSLEER